MRNLIEDLLTYSLLNKNSDLEEHVQLDKIVQQVITDYQPLIREANAQVIVDKLGDIKGNQLQLTQLFQNLLSNSIKYRRQDVPPVISISCRMVNESHPEFKTLPRYAENYLLIQFRDNGIGFEQEHAQKIFHVFQRLHGQSQYQGTGVGLAIVEKVVRNHKGAIYAESEPGKGTTFNIFLPG